MLLTINAENPQGRLIAQVAAALQGGAVIAYPTDTTYGIGCSIFNKKGIERIYQIKQREHKKPFSFICANLSDVSKYAQMSNFAFRQMRRLLPGPYTFILEATGLVPELVQTKQKTVGIRIPANKICLDLALALGHPLITTSANLSGEEPIGDPRDLFDSMKKQLDIVVDGGILPPDVSSVISLINNIPIVLRKGVGDVSWCVGEA
jgi:tRNA threonylcarbamoyl adenosine modification protein (Sua5/YciO/YrdC/YwlC family)